MNHQDEGRIDPFDMPNDFDPSGQTSDRVFDCDAVENKPDQMDGFNIPDEEVLHEWVGGDTVEIKVGDRVRLEDFPTELMKVMQLDLDCAIGLTIRMEDGNYYRPSELEVRRPVKETETARRLRELEVAYGIKEQTAMRVSRENAELREQLARANEGGIISLGSAELAVPEETAPPSYEEKLMISVDEAAAALGISSSDYLQRLAEGDGDDTDLDEPYDFDGNPAPPEIDERARRKARPVFSGVLNYFPDALLAVAELSRIGNEQHNPGEPLHWSKGKSNDHADALVRHLLDQGAIDPSTGLSHTANVAWRALALLQTEIENEREAAPLEVDYALSVDLPVWTGNEITGLHKQHLDINVRDRSHGEALLNDLAFGHYRGRTVKLWEKPAGGDSFATTVSTIHVLPSETQDPVAGGGPGD